MVKLDKHTFIHSISNFEIPSSLSNEVLSDLLDKYPAFNSLQLINAVVTNNEKPTSFEKELSKIATKVIDRAVLHDYIFKNKFTFTNPELKTAEKKIEPIDAPLNEKVEEAKIVKETTKEKEKEALIEKPISIIKPIIAKKPKIEPVANKKNNEEPKIEAKEKSVETKILSPTIEAQLPKKEVEKIEPKKVQENNTTKAPKTKTESRDIAYQNLSNDLFKNKLENSDSPTSEKDKRRIEAMKKLQEELFNAPAKKKPVTKKTEAIKEPKKDIIKEVPKLIEKAPIEKLKEPPVQKEVTKETIKIEQTKTSTPVKTEKKIEAKESTPSETKKTIAKSPNKEEKKSSIPKAIKPEEKASSLVTNKKKETLLKENETSEEAIHQLKDNIHNLNKTKDLTPLEKIRLTKELKAKNSSEEKAKNLISKLKQQQITTVDNKKKEATKLTKEQKALHKEPISLKKKLEQSIDKGISEKIISKPVVVEKETHLQKIEKLKAKIKASKLKEEAIKKEEEKKKVEQTIPTKTITKPIEEKEETIAPRVITPPILKATVKSVEKSNTKPVEVKNKTVKKPLTIQDFYKNPTEERQVKEEEKPFVSEIPHTKDSNFLKWLRDKKANENEVAEKGPFETIVKKEKIVEEKTTPKKEKVLPEEIEKEEDLVPFEKVSSIEHEMHLESKKSTDPLDDFISNQIARKKVVRKKSTKKTSSNLGLISETLAEILVIQQKYEEAIEVYNTLSLKYPEKSLYFAHQIEKIKNY